MAAAARIFERAASAIKFIVFYIYYRYNIFYCLNSRCDGARISGGTTGGMQNCRVKNERGGTMTGGSESGGRQGARVSERRRVGASGVWKECSAL
jgi:hypothetical protein